MPWNIAGLEWRRRETDCGGNKHSISPVNEDIRKAKFNKELLHRHEAAGVQKSAP